MFLTRRDLAGTIVAAFAILIYIANIQGWWYLGSNRWAAVTMLAIGVVGCSLGARIEGEKLSSPPIALLGVLGAGAALAGFAAVTTGEQWALLSLMLVIVGLWAGTTLRHALTPPPRLAAH